MPENAPPPWRAMPPYVSTMILRPVRPASPCGPPTTNVPVGLTNRRVARTSRSRPAASSTGATTCAATCRCSSS
ncbi:Uncharacterised protein [Mycobacteroides abscessus]|nr:Uncharacterised protein [Mycobacteroides abscessus]